MNTRAFGSFLAILLVATGPVFGALTDGLALYYSFDVNTGATVTDQSGNGHTAQVKGAQYTNAGRWGGAYAFNGTNWLEAGDILGLTGTTTQLTVCAWVKAERGFPVWRPIIGKQQAAAPYRGWVLHLDPYNCGLSQIIATYPEMAAAGDIFVMGDEQWHFVCGTYESYTGFMQCRLYVDGVLVDIDTRAGSHGATDMPTPLCVGMRYPNDAVKFHGMIDEVRIYKRILSDAEIAELAAQDGPASTNGPSLYYSFNTNTGSTVYDQSGNGHTALVKGATWVPNGIRGGAYQFKGTNWIEAGDILDLAGATTQLTVCAWIKANPAASGTEPIIVSKNQEASPYRGWILEQTFNNRPLVQITATHPQLVAAPNSTANIGDDQWHFVCGTYETYPNFMRCSIYVDGLLQDSGTRTGTYGSTKSATALTIGARQPNGISHWGFKGLIDEVRISSRILSDAEILALYDADKPVEPSTNFITTIGFSNDSAGDQDVTDFVAGETLYIRLKDVDMGGAEKSSTARAHLSQRNNRRMIQETVVCKAQSDGSFLGSCSLAGFQKGAVEIVVYMNGTRGERLMRDTFINIH